MKNRLSQASCVNEAHHFWIFPIRLMNMFARSSRTKAMSSRWRSLDMLPSNVWMRTGARSVRSCSTQRPSGWRYLPGLSIKNSIMEGKLLFAAALLSLSGAATCANRSIQYTDCRVLTRAHANAGARGNWRKPDPSDRSESLSGQDLQRFHLNPWSVPCTSNHLSCWC